jgi:hypothetical protein
MPLCTTRLSHQPLHHVCKSTPALLPFSGRACSPRPTTNSCGPVHKRRMAHRRRTHALPPKAATSPGGHRPPHAGTTACSELAHYQLQCPAAAPQPPCHHLSFQEPTVRCNRRQNTAVSCLQMSAYTLSRHGWFLWLNSFKFHGPTAIFVRTVAVTFPLLQVSKCDHSGHEKQSA